MLSPGSAHALARAEETLRAVTAHGVAGLEPAPARAPLSELGERGAGGWRGSRGVKWELGGIKWQLGVWNGREGVEWQSGRWMGVGGRGNRMGAEGKDGELGDAVLLCAEQAP